MKKKHPTEEALFEAYFNAVKSKWRYSALPKSKEDIDKLADLEVMVTGIVKKATKEGYDLNMFTERYCKVKATTQKEYDKMLDVCQDCYDRALQFVRLVIKYRNLGREDIAGKYTRRLIKVKNTIRATIKVMEWLGFSREPVLEMRAEYRRKKSKFPACLPLQGQPPKRKGPQVAEGRDELCKMIKQVMQEQFKGLEYTLYRAQSTQSLYLTIMYDDAVRVIRFSDHTTVKPYPSYIIKLMTRPILQRIIAKQLEQLKRRIYYRLIEDFNVQELEAEESSYNITGGQDDT